MATTKVKLPEFLEENPHTWLEVCKSVFEANKVTKDLDRYHHIVAALPAAVTSRLLDVFTAEPAEDGTDPRYRLLTERLLSLYGLNEYEAFQRFTSFSKLQPGQKPSALYADMMALLPWDVKPSGCPWWFRNSFLSKLPEHVRRHCKIVKFETLHQLALHADTVVEMQGSSSLPLHAVLEEYPPSLSAPVVGEGVETVYATYTHSDRQLCKATSVKLNLGK